MSVDEDEFIFTTEVVTREQIDSLRRLLALPVVEGASFDFDYSEDEPVVSPRPNQHNQEAHDERG